MSQSCRPNDPPAHSRRPFAFLAVAALLALASLPVAEATHLSLYTFRDPTSGESLDQGIGYTYEDDGAIARQPGGLLDGVANKVVLGATDLVGDGSLFLDSQWYQHAGLMVASNYHLAEQTGGRQMMYGAGGFMAWYGWWQDLDLDSRINDHHDSGTCHRTAPVDCASVDEFTWKGAGSGDSLEMVLYFLPGNLPGDFDTSDPMSLTGFGVWEDATDASPDSTFDDRTESSEQEQLWASGSGWPWVWTDKSLLMESQTVVVANPGKSSSALKYEISGPDVSVDVDTYESADPTLEALWASTIGPVPGQLTYIRGVPRAYADLVNRYVGLVTDAIQATSRTINEVTAGQTPPLVVVEEIRREAVEPWVAPYRDPAVAAANEILRAGNEGAAAALAAYYNPPWLMEPNHPGDVYPAAFFDGEPDALGVGNDYAAHAVEFHLFMDSHAVFQVPGGANAWTPLISPGTYGDNTYEETTGHIDPTPCDGCGDSGRGFKPTFVTVKNRIGLWHDANLDRHPGEYCDPGDPDGDWDPARGVCGNADFWGWDGWAGEEIIPICGTTTMNGGLVKVAPAPGYSWDDVTGQVMKIRLYDRPTYNAFHVEEMTMPTGTEPVELELDSCSGTDVDVRSVDMLFLPTGSLEISLVFEVTATMTKPFEDPSQGVDLPIESVTDVDLYLASF